MTLDAARIRKTMSDPHPGIMQSVMWADQLERSPMFTEMAREIGPQAARGLILSAAAGYWNASNNGETVLSRERLRDTSVTMDASRESDARNRVYNAVLAAAPGLSEDRRQFYSNEAFASLSAMERQNVSLTGSAASIFSITDRAASEAATTRNPNSQYAALMGAWGADDPGKTKGFFSRDAFGRTPFDVQTGGTGYQRGEGSSSNAYAGLDTAKWNPSTGGAGLTEKNFGNTRFPGAGLDLGTTKSLFAQGFNEHQILTAARDSKSLNLAPKEAAADVAWLRKVDPKNFEGHKKFLLDDQGREKNIVKLEEQIAAEQNPERKAKLIEARDAAKKEQDEKLAARKAKINHPKGQESLDHLARLGREHVRRAAAKHEQKMRAEPAATAREQRADSSEQSARNREEVADNKAKGNADQLAMLNSDTGQGKTGDKQSAPIKRSDSGPSAPQKLAQGPKPGLSG